MLKKLFRYSAKAMCLDQIFAFVFLLVLVPICLFSRILKKKYDVCLGPEPMINNVYHKKALEKMGYSARTFVCFTYYITKNFDKNFENIKNIFSLRYYISFFYVIWNFKCIYIYFNGGPLFWTPLRRFEAFLYRLSKVKIVVMPYGGDIQVLDRCPNLLYRHAVCRDYPQFQIHSRRKISLQIDYWTRNADHIISGCDWVDYMYHWDTLMPAHFSVDYDSFQKINPGDKPEKFTVLHAPNHIEIKGTRFIQAAVLDLQNEGFSIELEIVQKMPNEDLKRRIARADIVVDQLVIGWHGIFALEALSMGKPVVCYLRQDLIDLYLFDGCLKHRDDIPFINADFKNFKDVLREVLLNKQSLEGISVKSRDYVRKYHSLEAVGAVFDKINSGLGL